MPFSELEKENATIKFRFIFIYGLMNLSIAQIM
jgi:hypothetical protein